MSESMIAQGLDFMKPGTVTIDAEPKRNNTGFVYPSQLMTPNPTPMDLLPSKKVVSRQDVIIDDNMIKKLKPARDYIETLLLKELNRRYAKTGRPYKPISTRLAMMGTSKNDARLHILIFCRRELQKGVQRLVKKHDIRDSYTANDAAMPTFEITVHGLEPHMCSLAIEVISSSEVLRRANRAARLMRIFPPPVCGVPISFRRPGYNEQRNATLGGVIRMVTKDNGEEFFGMTASHMLRNWGHDLSTAGSSSSISGDGRINAWTPFQSYEDMNIDETQGYESEEETDNKYSDDEGHIDTSGISSGNPSHSHNGKLWQFEDTIVFGQVVDPPLWDQSPGTRKDYDWALFKCAGSGRDNSVNEHGMLNQSITPSVSLERPGATGNKTVSVRNDSRNARHAKLLAESGRILLGEGELFVDTFMITMLESAGERYCSTSLLFRTERFIEPLNILDGESGSWVIDSKSHEVYGQLVAVDALGDGYVIPMSDILDDIKLYFEAETVELGKFSDLFANIERGQIREVESKTRSRSETGINPNTRGRTGRLERGSTSHN
ncbi:hypothetical protein Daesc_010354 [Daldinia eschscholtzii]|uniref:Uncharacterized protein n=1 Tax=Daldinia eschscholtzii TaxID=292717 RepID=A0AAX6M813_9PEZI